MSPLLKNGIRVADFIAYRNLVTGRWYVNPVTGQVFSTATGCEMKFQRVHGGYLAVSWKYQGRSITVYKHRVIWIAAHGVPPFNLGLTVDHINGDKTDNRIANLQLLTGDENTQKTNRKLTAVQIREIRRRAAAGESRASLARGFGVSEYAIHRVVHKISYKEVEDAE